jgi:hypothetical protein
MIAVKQQAIPNYLATKNVGPNNRAILSNFQFLTEINPNTIMNPLPRQQQMAYSRYLYKRMQGDVSQVHSELLKEVGQDYNPGFVKEMEPFIWFISQFRLRGANSYLNADGLY